MPITDTFVYQEIHEQPAILRNLVENEIDAVHGLAAAINKSQVTHVIIAARGTSDNAARYAQYIFGSVNRRIVALSAPSLFSIYKSPPRINNALVIGISQSGKSPDIVSVLAEARQQGALTAVITNAPDSDLAGYADHIINIRAGKERSVAATKTYSAELTAIALLSAAIAGDRRMLAELESLPYLAEASLILNSSIAQKVERYRYMRDCVVIGRGYNYATAYEIALKLKEMTYTVVEPYSSADFLHGPMALLEPGFPVIAIAPSGLMLPDMAHFIQAALKRQAEIIAISDDQQILSWSTTCFPLPLGCPEWLSPVIAIIPGQLFSMHLAYTRGFDIDRPRAIQKVTETL
jgi:glucosamine--fructose-6-phosphate aminotransferase (isomerizing)